MMEEISLHVDLNVSRETSNFSPDESLSNVLRRLSLSKLSSRRSSLKPVTPKRLFNSENVELLPKKTSDESLKSPLVDSSLEEKGDSMLLNVPILNLPEIPKSNVPNALSSNQDNIMPEERSMYIHQVMQKCDKDIAVIGDFTRACSLPLVIGRNFDLPSISCETVANLLHDQDKPFLLLDCRYPYEYKGGHIKGAINTYSRKWLNKVLFSNLKPTQRGKLIIFYCEFSSKRGPSMYRYLREKDRNMHLSSYPSLFYPEMYVMEGGYRAFFESYKDLCKPSCYVEMIDKRFSVQCCIYYTKCKNEEKDQRVSHQLGLKFVV